VRELWLSYGDLKGNCAISVAARRVGATIPFSGLNRFQNRAYRCGAGLGA
jgi:hypothetical protein